MVFKAAKQSGLHKEAIRSIKTKALAGIDKINSTRDGSTMSFISYMETVFALGMYADEDSLESLFTLLMPKLKSYLSICNSGEKSLFHNRLEIYGGSIASDSRLHARILELLSITTESLTIHKLASSKNHALTHVSSLSFPESGDFKIFFYYDHLFCTMELDEVKKFLNDQKEMTIWEDLQSHESAAHAFATLGVCLDRSYKPVDGQIIFDNSLHFDRTRQVKSLIARHELEFHKWLGPGGPVLLKYLPATLKFFTSALENVNQRLSVVEDRVEVLEKNQRQMAAWMAERNCLDTVWQANGELQFRPRKKQGLFNMFRK